MKAEPLQKSGPAPSWRRLPRVKQWWTNSLQKLWGKWTMPLSPTRMTRAVPRVTSSSAHTWLPWIVGDTSLVCSTVELAGCVVWLSSEMAVLVQSGAVMVSWCLWVTCGFSNSSLHRCPQSSLGTCSFRHSQVDLQGVLLWKLSWHCHWVDRSNYGVC